MRLLLAEDEEELARAVRTVLEKVGGYEVDWVPDGLEAVNASAEKSYDCMIFDIMMPRMDGIEALSKIRAGGDVTPVIMLTAKSEIDDRITGLDAGADDYLTKPFAMKELMARIKAQTRRQTSYTPNLLTVGNVKLNTSESELSCENSVRLSRKENGVMQLLMLNEGKSLSGAEIFRKVWADEPDKDPGIVWVYISYLKDKLVSVAANLTIEGGKDGPYTLKK